MTPPLPFDVPAMLQDLRRWVECESPTWDAGAVDAMMDVAARDLLLMGARVERIPGRMGFGGCVRASLPHPRAGAPGVLLMGHLDTVHPVGTLASLPFRIDGERCFGPGILDMKGGIHAALEALRQLSRAGIETPLPVTVLLTSDEEVGSPSTRDLIEAEAARQACVLVPEPTHDGGVVTGRYAIARFELEATGQPSHAGWALAKGRSAIREMARQIPAVEDMTTPECTFSVGVIHGGAWVNCVSTTCRAEALSMARRQPDLDRGVAAMLALAHDAGGVRFDVRRGVTRPVWEPDAPTLALYETARGVAQHIGFDITHCSAGGGSDGNFTGALGIPTLDGLGLEGEGLHTLTEHVAIPSLLRRAPLLAGLFASIGA